MKLFYTGKTELELAIIEAIELKIMAKLGVITQFNDAFDNSDSHRNIIKQCVLDIQQDVRKLVSECKK